MPRPSEMTDVQLMDALHAVNDKLCSATLPERAYRLLNAHRDRLGEWLSIRIEDRAACVAAAVRFAKRRPVVVLQRRERVGGGQ